MLYRSGHLAAVVLGCLVAGANVSASDAMLTAPSVTAQGRVAQGEYIARAAGCSICHTDRKHKGKPFAGGRALRTPFGIFYAPNITPDNTTGIGTWTEQDFVRALRKGLRPDGANLYPVFPYTSYTRLSDDDARALWAYLRSLAPVRQVNKAHELKWYAPPRLLVWFWKQLYFTPGRYQANPQRSASWNRGAYLATAAAHCGECHTPRNILGGKKSDLRYAGAENKEEDFFAPNITPAGNTGIGNWSIKDLVTYFQLGLDPDGDTAGSVMAEFIDDGLSHLRKEDLQAIAEYIKTLPAIEHSLKKKNTQAPRKKEEWE